jgi:hypothetical protein
MAQSVGDATLTFLGDTTNLDQACARLPGQVDESMSAAADSVGQVGDALKDVSYELDYTAANANYAGGEIQEAMHKASTSTAEARGEVALLGEMFGVHLPRHVRGFVAELPGVGEALNAAFAATAVFFLLEALVQGTEKLSNFIGSTLIYTDSAKAAASAQIALNDLFIKDAAAINAADEALKSYGLTSVQKTQKAIAEHSKSLVDNSAKIEENKRQIAALAEEQTASAAAASKAASAVEGGLDVMADSSSLAKDNTQAIQALNNANDELAKRMKATTEEMKVLNLQLRDGEDAARKTSIAQNAAYSEAQISAVKTVGSAVLDLQRAQAIALVTLAKSTAGTRLLVDQQFAEQQYQLELSTAEKQIAAKRQAENAVYQIELANLTNRMNVQKTLGKDGAAAVAATQVQIEELTKTHDLKLRTEEATSNADIERQQKTHQAKLLEEATKFKNEFLEIQESVAKNGFKVRVLPNIGQDIQDFQKLEDAAKRLGLTLSGSLGEHAAIAKTDMDKLSAELFKGTISMRDFQQAEMKQLETQIAYDKEMGRAPKLVAEEQHALDLLKQSFDKVYKAEEKEKTFWDGFSAEFAKKSKNVGDEAQAMGSTMANAAAQMDQAFASAIMGALKSGQSIGAALEKATAEVLINLATQAAAHALYCTAMGIAELATGVTSSSAAEWFTAAAEFGLVAGAAGGAGLAMSGGGGGGSKGNNVSGSSNPGGVGQSSSSGGGTNQTTTVPHLAAGGIVSQPTMFMAGDSPSGGSADEAIMPLSDPAAMARISNALLSAPAMRAGSAAVTSSTAAAASASAAPSVNSVGSSSGGGGGDTNLNLHIKGLLDSGSLKKTMNKYQKLLQKNQANFTSSNSLRLTKRSQ